MRCNPAQTQQAGDGGQADCCSCFLFQVGVLCFMIWLVIECVIFWYFKVRGHFLGRVRRCYREFCYFLASLQLIRTIWGSDFNFHSRPTKFWLYSWRVGFPACKTVWTGPEQRLCSAGPVLKSWSAECKLGWASCITDSFLYFFWNLQHINGSGCATSGFGFGSGRPAALLMLMSGMCKTITFLFLLCHSCLGNGSTFSGVVV